MPYNTKEKKRQHNQNYWKEYIKNPEVKRRKKETNKQRYEANREKLIEQTKQWIEEHREQRQGYMREYDKRPERKFKRAIRAYDRKHIPKENCSKCSNKEKLEIHHAVYEKGSGIVMCHDCHIGR